MNAEEYISDLDNSVMEITQTEQKKRGKEFIFFKKEDRLRNPLDNIKRTSICIIRAPEEDIKRARKLLCRNNT